MSKFDMITWADEKYRAQAYSINNQHFTIDTAEPEDVYVANFAEDTFGRLTEIGQRYKRFVAHNCWHEKEWLSKL